MVIREWEISFVFSSALERTVNLVMVTQMKVPV